VDLVLSDEGKAILEKYGFAAVESEPAKSEGTATAPTAKAAA